MSKSRRLYGKKDPKWIQRLTTDDTVEEEEGTFAGSSTAEEIAIEIKRKAPNFQSAIAKVQMYLNRAGKRLSKSRIKEIKRAESILRNLYHRPDRVKANRGKKKASVKTAFYHVMWVDEDGKEHLGDAYAEAVDVYESDEKKDLFLKTHEISPSQLDEYLDFLISWRTKSDYRAKTEEERINALRSLKSLKQDMLKTYKKGENVPIFDLSSHRPTLVPKVAAIQEYDENKNAQIIFSSTEDALQFLADISKGTVEIKS